MMVKTVGERDRNVPFDIATDSTDAKVNGEGCFFCKPGDFVTQKKGRFTTTVKREKHISYLFKSATAPLRLCDIKNSNL